MRNLALADLTDDDLRRMLAENETLFVEHKGNIDHDAFNVAKAMCSFANMLGGWVLIGVTNSQPNDGLPEGWKARAPGELTDRVRQALETCHVDPIPAFAATVVEYGEKKQRIGVVRVSESSDVPHVIDTGQVYVRQVAADGRTFKATAVDSQRVLADLVERGRRGSEAARERVEGGAGPFARTVLGLQEIHRSWSPASAGSVIVLATPVTWHRVPDWSVSHQAREALEGAARQLGQKADDDPVHLTPHASGLAAEVTGWWRVGQGADLRTIAVKVAVDQAGILGASLIWPNPGESQHAIDLTLNGVRDELLRPPLEAVVALLNAGEFFGRARLHVHIYDLRSVAYISDTGGTKQIPNLPIGGEITLPVEDGDVGAVLDQWRGDVGRAAGYLVLR